MNSGSNNLGATLAAYLLKQSEQDAAITPMNAILDVARAGNFTDDQCFRLLARLWTLKRMMYYVFGELALKQRVKRFVRESFFNVLLRSSYPRPTSVLRYVLSR